MTDLPDSEALLYLRFDVVGAPGATTNFNFKSIAYNEGVSTASPSGVTFNVPTKPPTAAIFVAGRAVTSTGRGMRDVQITLIDEQGNSRATTSTAFGY